MILADKIINLRKKNGWSQEELAEKLGVSRQSISKWEGAQSVPDMNRILKLSEVFGVSTDYLLKDDAPLPEDMETQTAALPVAREDYPARPVSMEEAVEFLAYRNKIAGRMALGVMMCILSPVMLIILAGLSDAVHLRISENRAAGIGLIILFLLVGGAVALFVTTSIAGHGFEYFEKELIDTAYGVEGMVRERQERFRHTYTAHLTVGIVLCVISVIPIFAGILLFGETETVETIGTAAVLVLVAIGVFLIVRACTVWGGFQMLLQEGDYTVEQKVDNMKDESFSTIFWCACIVLYLLPSFLTNAWHKTWIIWPIAGVTYGLILAVMRAMRRKG